MRIRVLIVVLALGAATAPRQALAQSATPAAAPAAQDPQNPPAAAGEDETKPVKGFKSLFRNLGDDIKHMPRVNSLYWLAGGGALALAVHNQDVEINEHMVGHDALFTGGKYLGSTELLLPAAVATYFVARHTGSRRVQHLGMDEVEAVLLAEGIVEGLKVAVRRPRPVQLDGNQSNTYSFPSGHSAVTFAAATVLQQHLGYRAGIPTYTIASWVAMSRLHDNRHYASDVVFGAAIGIVVGRSVTWHGRNYYASPMLVPGGGGIMVAAR